MEAPEVTGIRADSNYLTPKLGLLSADTWTVVALYIRNLLLNWLLFVPFFMGCFMIPRVCAAILSYVAAVAHLLGMFHGTRLAGAIFTTFGLGCASMVDFVGKAVAHGRPISLARVAPVGDFGCAIHDRRGGRERVHRRALDDGRLWGPLWDWCDLGRDGLFSGMADRPLVVAAATDPTERRIEPLDVAFWTLSAHWSE